MTDTFAAVHRHVHHDIKPQNLLPSDDGRLQVVDFGIANRNWGTRAYGDQSTYQGRRNFVMGIAATLAAGGGAYTAYNNSVLLGKASRLLIGC